MLIEYEKDCDSVWREILHRKEESIRTNSVISKVVLLDDEYMRLIKELPYYSLYFEEENGASNNRGYLGHFCGIALYFGGSGID